jgi:hypothetical protein
MKSFKKQAVAAALAFAAVVAGSAPAFTQYAGLPYGAHRVYGTHPYQVRPRARAYYDYAAPGGYYGYVAPRAYYDYVPPGDAGPAPNALSAFYDCPPKCW